MNTLYEYLLSKSKPNVDSNEYYIVWSSFDVLDKLNKLYHDVCFIGKDYVYLWILNGKEIINALKEFNKIILWNQFKAYCIPEEYDKESIKDALVNGEIKLKDLKEITYEQIYETNK